ncbi:undecaprenyl-diphosphate phosphatase [Mycoplasmatota bacterium WC30]
MSFLELLKYIFLGAVQGFTEILPISSSGHVSIFQVIFNLETDTGLFFITLLNLGSFIAIAIFFWKFEKEIITDFFKYIFKKDREKKVVNNFKYSISLIIASIPIALVGFLFANKLYIYFQDYTLIVVGVGSLVTATILYLSKDIVNKYVSKNLTLKDGIIIGLIQPVSVILGLSRLALTTCTGLNRKVTMETALKFSILLYLPISLGELIVNIGKLVTHNQTYFSVFESSPDLYFYYFVAFAISIGVTFFALNKIFIWVRKGKFMFFAIYNAIIGLIALLCGIITY